MAARRAAAADAAAAAQLEGRRARAAARAVAMQQRYEARADAQSAFAGSGSADADLGVGAEGAGMPGRKRGAAEGGVAAPRGEEAKKRGPRGAGGRSAGGDGAGCSGERRAGSLARERPEGFDVVLGENEAAYASYTCIGGVWMGGLFAKRALEPGEAIAAYVGTLLSSEEADESSSEYLMTAVDVHDKRRMVVIDGRLDRGNLAGFANYASNRVANADFEDRGRATARSKGAPRTNVVLQAKVRVEAGREIRVDYDMGVVGRPFRAQMIKRGVAASELDGAGYAEVLWARPSGGGARARGDARARARSSGAGGGEEAEEHPEAGGVAEGRKRGSRAAQVPSPRGVEWRKRALRSASQLGDG